MVTGKVATLPSSDEEWLGLEYRIKRLFTPAAPISEAERLAGRRTQMRRLIDAVLEKGRHAVLYGERGVGKTSLANTFHETISGVGKDMIMPIRKQTSPEDDYSDLWRKVFREIQYEIKKNGYYGKEITEVFSAAEKYPEKITSDDVIRELSQASTQTSPVIIFDEFDCLNDEDTKLLMSHTIKALTDSGVNATIVLVGIAEDVDSLVSGHQSIERNVSEIKMPRMSKDELNEILDKRLPQENIRIEGDARWKIITLSRGLPHYVHALGRDSAIHAIRQKRTLIKEEDVDEAIKTFLSQSDQTLNNAYKLATDSNYSKAHHKQALLACALTKTDDEGRFVAKDVVQPMSGILGYGVKIDKFQSHLTAFSGEARGTILERTGKPRAYKYRFREPKMQPYVIMRGIADGRVTREAMKILSSPEQPRLSNEF